MSDYLALNLAVAAFAIFLGAIIVRLVYLGARMWAEDRSDHPMATPSYVPMYCGDCGQAMVSFRSQDGFSSKTGLPNFVYERACPDATMNRGAIYPSWPSCGRPTRSTPTPGLHMHVDPEVTTIDCPACLDIMLANGAIKPADVIKLYREAGIRT